MKTKSSSDNLRLATYCQFFLTIKQKNIMTEIIKKLEKKGHKFVVLMNQYEYKYMVAGVKFKNLKQVKKYFGL